MKQSGDPCPARRATLCQTDNESPTFEREPGSHAAIAGRDQAIRRCTTIEDIEEDIEKAMAELPPISSRDFVLGSRNSRPLVSMKRSSAKRRRAGSTG
jgi:hypothetical protein